MARSKQTQRPRPGTRRLLVSRGDDGLDDGDDWDDLDDVDDRDLEALLDSMAASRRTSRSGRPFNFVAGADPGPLARAWQERVDGCGADAAAQRSGEALLRGPISGLYVERGRLQAQIGAGRDRVAIDFLPPPLPLTAAVVTRFDEARATLPEPRHVGALVEAILAAGPAILPAPTQTSTTCTCPRGKLCEHAVAAVLAFGRTLDGHPELLLHLWGIADAEPRGPQPIVVAPLPPDRVLLGGDLGALFGIDLIEPVAPVAPTPAPAPAPPPEPTPVAEAPPRGRGRGRKKVAPTPAPTPAPKPAPEPAPEPTPAPAPARASKKRSAKAAGSADEGPRVPPSALPEVRLDYLKILGIKKKKIDTWLREGILLPTDRPDVYLRTPEANRLIAELLAR